MTPRGSSRKTETKIRVKKSVARPINRVKAGVTLGVKLQPPRGSQG